MTDAKRNGPVLIELEPTSPIARPDEAPLVPEQAETAAMTRVVALAQSRPSRLARWFWSILTALVGFVVSLAAYDYVMGLLARSPVLGGIAFGLLGLFVAVLAALALREFLALSRMRRLDRLQKAATDAAASDDLPAARQVVRQIEQLYSGRADAVWGLQRLSEQAGDQMDAGALLGLAEVTVMQDLDTRARSEVEAAARQVALVTAIVPLALADVFAALTANLRMIRRIAEIYGGRAGWFGSWRLIRTVLVHLAATGAVAVGDDLIHSVAGGGVLSKLSRRFGEGVINGALTARVGVAAIEVCRPLPFVRQERPSVTALVKRALTGLFGNS